MLGTRILAALVAISVTSPAFAEDKGKQWCNPAHMKVMNDSIAKMTDPEKQKEASKHLAASEAAMKANNTAGCVKHMEETHKVMGL